MFFYIDVNYLCKKIKTEFLFKSKPKPITPLDSFVYTLNNRKPSYISELRIPMSQSKCGIIQRLLYVCKQ